MMVLQLTIMGDFRTRTVAPGIEALAEALEAEVVVGTLMVMMPFAVVVRGSGLTITGQSHHPDVVTMIG